MAAGLTGSQPGWQVVRGSVEAQASLQVSGFLSFAPLQTKALENSDKRREEAPTATGVRVCFGLLLITACQAEKPLRLQPLHQSNTLTPRRAAGTRDRLCYSPLSGLAALW